MWQVPDPLSPHSPPPSLSFFCFLCVLPCQHLLQLLTDNCRIMPLLRDRHGREWRSKLPPNPDADKVMPALLEMNQRYNFSASGQDPKNSTKGSEAPSSQGPENSVKESESPFVEGPVHNEKGSETPSNQDPERIVKGSETSSNQGPEIIVKGSETSSDQGPERNAKGSEQSFSQGPEKVVKGPERDLEGRGCLQDGKSEAVTASATTVEDSSSVNLPPAIPVITSSASPGEQIRVVQSTSTVTSSGAKVAMATKEEEEEGEDPVTRKAKFDDWKSQGNAHTKKVGR